MRIKIITIMFFINVLSKNVLSHKKLLYHTSSNKSKKIFSEYKPKTINQKIYKKSLYNPDIHLLFCTGPAGTGKTLFACQYAIETLQKQEIDKIIITRPNVAIDGDMGYLPGDIKAKMHPYTLPIFDIFQEYYTKKDIENMVFENIIEIAPLCYMQGRTFKNSIIIADEMQNSTPFQMFMLLTRIGDKSKMIVTGDPMQTTIKNNGLSDIIGKITNNYLDIEDMKKNNIDIINLYNNDIQRSNIVKNIEKLYNNEIK